MWRRNIDEDWERTRDYLFRSLFQEIPLLSPVPEEDESFDSIRQIWDIRRPPTYATDAPDRPYSPLPPLIIEREPNRHDEPEEFYIKLKKKMLKVYRKLFIENQSDISIETSDEEMANVECISGTGLCNLDAAVDGQNSPNEVSQTADDQNARNNNRKRTAPEDNSNSTHKFKRVIDDLINESSSDGLPNSTSSETDDESDSLSSRTSNEVPEDEASATANNNEVSSPTDHSVDYRQVTTQAEVHRDANYDGIVEPGYVLQETNEDDIANDEDSEILERKRVPDNIGNQSSSKSGVSQEIEMMRTPRIHPSIRSLQEADNDSDSHCEDVELEEEPRLHESEAETSSSDPRESNSVMEVNFDLLFRVSTPIDRNVTKNHDVTNSNETVSNNNENVTNSNETVSNNNENVTNSNENVSNNNENVTNSNENVSNNNKNVTNSNENVSNNNENVTNSNENVSNNNENVTNSNENVSNNNENVTNSNENLSNNNENVTNNNENVINRKENSRGSSRRRKSSSSTVSSKRMRYDDAGTQTSFDLNRDLNGIFVGVPRVYRLCSCVNHICGC